MTSAAAAATTSAKPKAPEQKGLTFNMNPSWSTSMTIILYAKEPEDMAVHFFDLFVVAALGQPKAHRPKLDGDRVLIVLWNEKTHHAQLSLRTVLSGARSEVELELRASRVTAMVETVVASASAAASPVASAAAAVATDIMEAAAPNDAKTDAQTVDALLALFHVVILRAHMTVGKQVRLVTTIRYLKRNTDTRSDDVASKGTGVYLTLAEALLSVAAADE